MSGLNKIVSGRVLSTGISKSALLAAVAAAALWAAPARAALLLTISEPGFAPATGTVSGDTDSFTGSYGDFSTNIVIGFTNSATPAPVAELEIQSLDVLDTSSTGTKTLTISLTDTAYTFPGSPGQTLLMTSSLGGTLSSTSIGDTVTFQSTATPSAGPIAAPGPQTFTSPVALPGSISFDVPTATDFFTQTGSYSLNSQITTSLSNADETANLSGSTTVVTAPAPVPEPASLSLLTLGAFGLLRRRRRTVRSARV